MGWSTFCLWLGWNDGMSLRSINDHRGSEGRNRMLASWWTRNGDTIFDRLGCWEDINFPSPWGSRENSISLGKVLSASLTSHQHRQYGYVSRTPGLIWLNIRNFTPIPTSSFYRIRHPMFISAYNLADLLIARLLWPVTRPHLPVTALRAGRCIILAIPYNSLESLILCNTT